MAIYARENGQGMAFPVSDDAASPAVLTAVDVATPSADQDDEPQPPSPPAGRPALKRVK
jgi:stringent starvation protein B